MKNTNYGMGGMGDFVITGFFIVPYEQYMETHTITRLCEKSFMT